MKRFMKGCAITALVLLVIGLVMTIICGAFKGGAVVGAVVNQVTGGRVSVNLDELSEIGQMVGDSVANGIEEGANYDIQDNTVFDDAFDIFKGDIQQYNVGSEVHELKVEAGGCKFIIEESKDSNYYLKAQNTGKFQGYVKNGVLYVRAARSGVTLNGGKVCEVTVYIPENAYFDKADLEIGAGVLEFEKLSGKEISMEVGAGQIKAGELWAQSLKISAGAGEIIVDEMNAAELKAEVGVGNLELNGSVTKKAEVDCAMGNITLKLDGEERDFNYEVECGMGNVTIDGESYSGLAHDKKIENGAAKNMKVECAMGNIEISF